MNIAVVGTGYVGLVSGTCFSEMGVNVTCVDVDKNKVQIKVFNTGENIAEENIARIWNRFFIQRF